MRLRSAPPIDVRKSGLTAARHLRGELYEVRAEGVDSSYRLLFAEEGAKGRVLLALHAISKKTRKTPPQAIDLAERRLADWRRQARLRRVCKAAIKSAGPVAVRASAP